MGLKQLVENHPVFIVFGALLAGFLAGFGAYEAIMRVAQLTPVSQAEYNRLKQAEARKDQAVAAEAEYEELQKAADASRDPHNWIHRLAGTYQVERGQVYSVDFYNTACTNADLERLRAYPKLRFLNLRGCSQITSQGFAVLGDLSSLEIVTLSGTAINDDDLKQLRYATQLITLDLSQTKVSDNAMLHLDTFQQLEILDLSRTNVGDAGISHLASLKRLSELYLARTNVTDESVGTLASLTTLKWLDVAETAVTDAGKVRITEINPDLRFERRQYKPLN